MLDKLSNSQLQSHIRTVSGDSTRVAFTNHALVRMKARQITRDMALEVLRKGRLIQSPESNIAKGSIECRLEKFVTGRDIAIVAALSDSDPDLLVITAMELGK
jgi:Domain of unknown function (DUF4258)